MAILASALDGSSGVNHRELTMSMVFIRDLRTSFTKVEALLNAGKEVGSEKVGKADQFFSFDDRLDHLANADGMKLIR